MNSAIFQKMGLRNLDLGYLIIALIIFVAALLILTIIQMKKLIRLNIKYHKFMQGKSAKSLEEDIMGLYEDNKYIIDTMEKNRKDIAVLFEKLAIAFQKAGLVKYDAFQHMGGKLSYCLALLDEHNSGIILNSVHSAEGCYSYTKEIIAGESTILLGEEEKQALKIAMEKISATE